MQFKSLFAVAFFGLSVLAADAEVPGDVPTTEQLALLYEETFPGTIKSFNSYVLAQKGTGCELTTHANCVDNCNKLSPPTVSDGANAGCLLYCAKTCPTA